MKKKLKCYALLNEDNELIATYASIEYLKRERKKYLKKGVKTKVVNLWFKDWNGGKV